MYKAFATRVHARRALRVLSVSAFGLLMAGCATDIVAAPTEAAPAAALSPMLATDAATMQAMADTIRQADLRGGIALVDALRLYAADLVTIRNFPPRTRVDGVKTGREWLDFERAAILQSGQMIRELTVTGQEVRIDGDKIILSETMSGVSPSGFRFSIPSRLEFIVHNGRIIGYDAYYDASQTPPEFALMEEGIHAGSQPQRPALSDRPTPIELAYWVHDAHLADINQMLDLFERYAADQVTIRYHPPRPFVEGTMTGEQWISFERQMVARTGDVSAQLETVDARIAVIGNDIIIQETLLGTDPSGAPFRVPFVGELHIANGRITGYDAWFDPSSTPAFMEEHEREVRAIVDPGHTAH